jgi:MFS family permease
MTTSATRRQAATDVAQVQRRVVRTLSASQTLGGIAVAGAVPAGALIAASLAGEGFAGLAQTFGVLGAAVFALPLARIALNRGRRAALSVGYGLGLLGAVIVVLAGVTRSLPLVLLGTLLVGVASAAGYQARYAATDLAVESHRARALSIVVWAGTVGAVLGPNLLNVSGNVALSWGLPQLTGPYLQAGLMLALAVGVLIVFLRPDPYLLARQVAARASADGVGAAKPRLRDGIEHLRLHRRAMLGVTSVALGHVVMVMVMVMTPVHMSHVDVSLQLIGLVISVHVLGMYAFSPVVGWLVDRVGRLQMVLAGVGVLLASCLVCGLAPADSVPVLAVGLFLLGLGWSCTLIAGSTVLTDDVGENERPSVQGLSDLIMNLAAAGGGVVAGLVVLVASYAVLCAVAAVPVVVLGVLVVRERSTEGSGRRADEVPLP